MIIAVVQCHYGVNEFMICLTKKNYDNQGKHYDQHSI